MKTTMESVCHDLSKRVKALDESYTFEYTNHNYCAIASARPISVSYSNLLSFLIWLERAEADKLAKSKEEMANASLIDLQKRVVYLEAIMMYCSPTIRFSSGWYNKPPSV